MGGDIERNLLGAGRRCDSLFRNVSDRYRADGYQGKGAGSTDLSASWGKMPGKAALLCLSAAVRVDDKDRTLGESSGVCGYRVSCGQ